MKALVCDMCNKTYQYYDGINTDKGPVNGFLLLQFEKRGTYNKRGYFDMCPECSTKFINALGLTQIKEVGEMDNEQQVETEQQI